MEADWTYIITTLVFRYLAIFVVLLALICLLQANGAIVSRLMDRPSKRKNLSAEPLHVLDVKPDAGAEIDHGTVIAIGLALSLYLRQQSTPARLKDPPEQWKIAGRLAQLRSWYGRG